MVLFAAIGCRQSTGPVPPPAHIIAGMNRGVSLMGQYLYDEAVQAFEGVLRDAPDLTDARINLAIARFNRNGKEDLEEAAKLLKAVLEKEPNNLRALYSEAILLQHLGQADQALIRLEQVVQARPDDGAAWYLVALCKQRLSQPAEAEFLQAVRHRPYLFSAYYQLYQTALRGGEPAKAAEYLERFKTLRESPLGESIELPQYNQMGDLALAQPLPTRSVPPIARSQYRLQPPLTVFSRAAGAADTGASALTGAGVAAGDLDGDGRPDLVVPLGEGWSVALLRQTAELEFTPASGDSGLEGLEGVLSCALGDFDNDGVPDLFVTGSSGNRLLRGKGDGTFLNVTVQSGLDAAAQGRSALFLDADHDGDLDLFVCHPTANRLWNNNGDGQFTEIAEAAGIACPDGGTVLVLAGDLDGDRDHDLVLLRQDGPARWFRNELLGRYVEVEFEGLDIRGDRGGALQDFNGDGLLDLVVLGGDPAELRLFTGQGQGKFKPETTFEGTARALASHGPIAGFRFADIDLDGDFDLVGFGTAIHLLLNDGKGRFALQTGIGKPPAGRRVAGLEVLDLDADLVPDLLSIEAEGTLRVGLAMGELAPPSTALAIRPSGVRGRDGRTRSPAGGQGVTLTARAGLREQKLVYTGQTGGPHQSWLPAVFGLGGVPQADYVQFLWPDGVAQVELAMAAGQTHDVAELQRKISSCPVLFAWNGSRFEFVTDFAGVGGLGYFSAPGVAAPPQVLEHVKIEPDQLQPRDGMYELRVTEPMEETAYIDRLELLAIDHPPEVRVFPDERLAIAGPLPTRDLLIVDQRWFPERASDPSGRDCREQLARVDRQYAYAPQLDRRYVGFCRPHTLELDFGDRLGELAEAGRVFLFINGFIEYPYSQTVYAASQSRVGWEPIRVDRLESDGRWHTIVPDGGAPGGMARTMTIDLSGQLTPATRKLRLTTNLEIYYDQIFVAASAPRTDVTVRSVPMRDALLRYVGFAREYSPDGRLPLIFDYELRDTTAPFHRLKGRYTRYGPVTELLAEFDDRYVLVGSGDEIALRFDATSLPSLAPGSRRSFILVSHAYCKDMDLYTATPRTLEPLPFRAMSQYPYPATERYPDSEEHRTYLETYNTRHVE
jgi:Tfp pilus assembly protein PilF